MNEALPKFEAYLLTEKCVSVNTYHAYMRDIRQFEEFLTEQDVVLVQVKLADFKLYLKELKKNSISARSISRKISSLKIFFKWAHDRLSWVDYAQELIFPKVEKKLPHYLSCEEVQELLEAAQADASDIGKRNLVMLYLLYSGGLRITELTMLRTTHIDFDTGCLKVTGKGGKDRIIPLPHNMMSMMREYLVTTHKNFVTEHQATDYLFPIFYAGVVRAISRQAFWAILKELCKKTTIKRVVSPHVLRHSLATHLLKNGANLRSLQLLLGHENLSTVQIYTHVEMSYLRTIYDKKHPRS